MAYRYHKPLEYDPDPRFSDNLREAAEGWDAYNLEHPLTSQQTDQEASLTD